MSQQINLLIEKQRRPAISAERSSIVLVLLLVALLTYAMIERNKTSKVQDAAKSGEARLKGEQASLTAIQDKLTKRPKPDQLNAEVAFLSEVAANKQQVLQALRAGGMGSEAGYYAHLVALAKVSENGVWVTSVNISDSGTRMAIEGRSLSPEAVIRYAQRLNEQFGPFGVKLSTLELSPQQETSERGRVPVVKFALR